MEMGLVSHRAAPGDLRAEQDRIVAALLAKPPEALRQTQALLRAQGGGVMERMQEESARFAERLQSDEVKQAIAAFFAARSKAD
jgi:hypothetical protein